MLIIKNYKYIYINRWLFLKLIVRFTHTDRIILDSLSKEIVTFSRISKFESEIQSLYHINGHITNSLNPHASHIIRTWKTSLSTNEDQIINVNKGIYSIASNFFSISTPKIRGDITLYNSTKFSEEVLQGSRLNLLLASTGSSIFLNQDQKLSIDNLMFSMSKRNSYPDFLINGVVGIDLKTTLRVPPFLRSGEYLESYILRDKLQYMFSSDIYSFYKDQYDILNKKNIEKKELDVLYHKITQIVESNLDINDKMKEITKECLLFDSIVISKEKSVGFGVLLSPLISSIEIQKLSQEIENSGKLSKLYQESDEIYNMLSIENKNKIFNIILNCIQTNSMGLKDYKCILNILEEIIKI